jgi:hypothetical protein
MAPGQSSPHPAPHRPTPQLCVKLKHAAFTVSHAAPHTIATSGSDGSGAHRVHRPFQHTPRPLHTAPPPCGHGTSHDSDRYAAWHWVHAGPAKNPSSADE